MSKYATIHNPLALVFKHEVWYAGEQEVFDLNGAPVGIKKPVVVKVGSFAKQGKAEGFIRYRQELAAFKEAA